MLTAADRDFLTSLGEVVFGNPFSASRAELIVHLAPQARLGDLTQNREALVQVVGPRLRALRAGNAQERRLMEPALLYVSYHRYVPELDALIERQAKGGASLPVPFAEEAIGGLVEAGFDEDCIEDA